MPRIPISKNAISANGEILSGAISDEDYAHITRVMRLGPGDTITVFDDELFEYEGRIKSISPASLTMEVRNARRTETEPALELNLFQSILKGGRMDEVIREATQLGVSRVYPVISQRTVVRTTSKIARWNKIALESTKQCGRTAPPVVAEPVGFADSMGIRAGSEIRIILYENSGKLFRDCGIPERPARTANLFVGPEGGFSEEEISLASENGYTPVGLGKRILKAETAAVVGLALMQSRFGDI